MIVIAWGFVLFVFTCTRNLDALLFHQTIHFNWVSHPHLSDLLMTKDAHFADPYYLFIKFGHFTGFGVFFLCVYLWKKKTSSAALYAILYAALTEVLQLYFARDGRIIDMGIDTLGILVAYLLLQERKIATAQSLKES